MILQKFSFNRFHLFLKYVFRNFHTQLITQGIFDANVFLALVVLLLLLNHVLVGGFPLAKGVPIGNEFFFSFHVFVSHQPHS